MGNKREELGRDKCNQNELYEKYIFNRRKIEGKWLGLSTKERKERTLPKGTHCLSDTHRLVDLHSTVWF